LKKLRADLEGKLLQREQLTERKRAEMEEKKRMVDEALEGGGQHPTDDGEDEDEEDDDEDEEEDGEGDGEDAVPAANGAKV
jgi:transcription initiation factor TFIID subunit 7